MEPEAGKTCRDCGEMKPRSEFYKCSANSDGLHSYCKTCNKERNRLNNEKRADKRRVYSQKYREENRELIKARQSKYYNDNRDKMNEQSRQWRINNPERAAANTRDWLARNPGKSAQYAQVRHARKIDALVDTVEVSVVMEVYGTVCYLCETKIEGDMQIDHVIPLSRGGQHSYENVRPTHGKCNRIKSDRLIESLDLPFPPPSSKEL